MCDQKSFFFFFAFRMKKKVLIVFELISHVTSQELGSDLMLMSACCCSLCSKEFLVLRVHDK